MLRARVVVKKCFKEYRQRLDYKGDRLEDMRGNLSLVATVILTLTFEAALNPLGSIIQQAIRPSDPYFNLTSSFNTSIGDGPLGCLPFKDVSGRNGSSCPG
ncbi:hypothetical protein K1719_009307 [Acacia pycnantha]|nr:hypothetical protein K1719_009307 [Acacia pycnantha]